MAPPAPPPDGAALSRELSELFIELSVALQRYAMYPDGHPTLQPVTDNVTRRLDGILERRGTLSVGVARHQLVIEGVATDPKHPMLRELAERLHRHHLGAVTFSRGVDAVETAAALKRLAVDPERSRQPLGLGPREALRLGSHIELHPVSFGHLELVAAEQGAESRGPPLWVGLARAALATDGSGADVSEPLEPDAMAAAIDNHPSSAAYDQAIVGSLLEISESLRASGGPEGAALRRRVSRLVGAMQPETLRRLVEMGGDLERRKRFVLDASQGMPVEAVLQILKAAADASGETISHGLLRMLAKMAVHASEEGGTIRPYAEAELRAQVRSLIANWTLDDPNPDGYGQALEAMARARPGTAGADTGIESPDPQRLVRLALELDHRSFALWRAVSGLVDRAEVVALADLLDELPEQHHTAREIWRRLASPGVARRLAVEPVDFAALDRLLPRLDLPGLEPLLDALADSPNRVTRIGLLDRLATVPVDLGDVLQARLADPRWYVQRNMLVLLDAERHRPANFSPAAFLTHGDPRVRREAVKSCLQRPAEREAAVLAGLADPDAGVLELVLVAAEQECSVAAMAVLIRGVADDTVGPDQRPLAIKLLGRARSPEAVQQLLRFVDGGTSWFGRRRLAPKSRDLLSALEALASGWARHPRARRMLIMARRASDPEIRAAARSAAG